MREDIAGREIRYFDAQGRGGSVRYDELRIRMGESSKLTLAECLFQEQRRIEEFRRNSRWLARLIRQLEPFYDEIEADPEAYLRHQRTLTRGITELPTAQRLRRLDSYYVLNRRHDRLLTRLTNYLLAGSEADHSAHNVSLLRRAIDYTCRVMRHKQRKTKYPAAIHAIEAARGAAKNSLRITTIIATLLHDVIEERLDDWTEQLINRELQDPAYGEYSGCTMKQVPVSLRHKIIQKHIDAYNDRASGIFFAIGLSLYEHVRHFTSPGRYYETLHSIADMVAALSRRRDQSYYSYLQQLLYPKPEAELDSIGYQRLRQELLQDFLHTDELLDPYLNNVHNFYYSGPGRLASREEIKRNSYREILAKILDRLNNTRDMERSHGFSLASRLYGTAFKNIFFLQAVEDKMRKPSFNTEERNIIEVKFINKPKVAALYQLLDDIEHLRKQGHGELIDFLDIEIIRYMSTRNFWRLTPPGRAGYFNGLIYLFNDITLGRKSSLVELERRPEKLAEALVAFRAVLESFLVYPNLEKHLRADADCPTSSRRLYYRIKGMGPGLERRSSAAQEQQRNQLTLKSFSRVVI